MTWFKWRAAAAFAAVLAPLTMFAPSPARAQAAAGKLPFEAIRDKAVDRFAVRPADEPRLTAQQEIVLMRKRVKYIFVLYQENRSFDSYFGTFPGADGLFSQPAAKTPGFYQLLVDTDGKSGTIHPFRIGPALHAADTDDIDHSHPRIVAKMDIADGKAKMDRFALTEEKKYSPDGNPSLKAKQFGELAMAYEDGDTVPFLWRYANRFALFDHIFQLMTGPSTPGNLAIIGAQTGETQWMLHPDQVVEGGGDSGPGVPVTNDANPFWGSGQPGDTSGMPKSPHDKKRAYQRNLTYATIPLTIAGREIGAITKSDRDPAGDLRDVDVDIAEIARSGGKTVEWGWYEEGFDREPTDTPDVAGGGDPVDASGTHASYITHHNGPQYFGYISNNPKESSHLHGLNDFYTDLANGALPASGGVFYVKGGMRNTLGLKPADPDPAVQKNFRGDDDHPAYSDAQISEAMVAESVNRIASSRYWPQCAIVITWDDSEGDYDHVPPPLRSAKPDGTPLSDGPRVPLILISPYARVHAVSHEIGDHASVVKLVDRIFALKPLADLPDELRGRRIGEAKGLKNQGPLDDLTPGITDLFGGFDPARLTGKKPPLPAWYAQIPENLVRTLPQQSGYGWHQIGVVPTDYALGVKNEIPADFNPRPATNPTP